MVVAVDEDGHARGGSCLVQFAEQSLRSRIRARRCPTEQRSPACQLVARCDRGFGLEARGQGGDRDRMQSAQDSDGLGREVRIGPAPGGFRPADSLDPVDEHERAAGEGRPAVEGDRRRHGESLGLERRDQAPLASDVRGPGDAGARGRQAQDAVTASRAGQDPRRVGEAGVAVPERGERPEIESVLSERQTEPLPEVGPDPLQLVTRDLAHGWWRAIILRPRPA